MFVHPENKSGIIAKDRLKLMLTAQQLNWPSTRIIMLKNDLIQTSGRYLDVDREHVSITIKDHPMKLEIQIPIHGYQEKKETGREKCCIDTN